MRRRLPVALTGAALAVLLLAAPTLACGGLIGPNGAVNLLRTTTFAGYHDGVEHYVTVVRVRGRRRRVRLAHAAARASHRASRRAATGRSSASSARPTRRRPARGLFFGAAAAADSAEVIMEVQIDALDITVLKGGGAEVGAVGHPSTGSGCRPTRPRSSTSTPTAARSSSPPCSTPTAAKERGQQIGDGTPVHITIPTPNPWVPIRILALGKTGQERVDADVYLLTDRAPAFLPAADRRQRHAPRPQRRRQRPCSSTTCAPTGAWAGSPGQAG